MVRAIGKPQNGLSRSQRERERVQSAGQQSEETETQQGQRHEPFQGHLERTPWRTDSAARPRRGGHPRAAPPHSARAVSRPRARPAGVADRTPASSSSCKSTRESRAIAAPRHSVMMRRQTIAPKPPGSWEGSANNHGRVILNELAGAGCRTFESRPGAPGIRGPAQLLLRSRRGAEPASGRLPCNWI